MRRSNEDQQWHYEMMQWDGKNSPQCFHFQRRADSKTLLYTMTYIHIIRFGKMIWMLLLCLIIILKLWWDFLTTFSNSSDLLSKMALLLTKHNTFSHQISFRVEHVFSFQCKCNRNKSFWFQGYMFLKVVKSLLAGNLCKIKMKISVRYSYYCVWPIKIS